MPEWRLARLGDLVEPSRGISYGIVQPGFPVVDGVPIIRVSDVRDGRIAVNDPLRVAQSVEAATMPLTEHRKSVCSPLSGQLPDWRGALMDRITTAVLAEFARSHQISGLPEDQ